MALAVLFLAFAYGLYGHAADRSDSLSGNFAVDFPSGGLLRVYVPSGTVRIVGGSEDRVVLSYGGKEPALGRQTKVSLDRSGQTGDLRIRGGARKRNFEIIVQVPRRSNLRVRMPAGQLEIAGVTGDKDITVYSGEVTVEIGESNQYSRVDAFVLAGEISARPFGVETGGLFRSFEVQDGGIYRLHAHVYTGELTLKH